MNEKLKIVLEENTKIQLKTRNPQSESKRR